MTENETKKEALPYIIYRLILHLRILQKMVLHELLVFLEFNTIYYEKNDILINFFLNESLLFTSCPGTKNMRNEHDTITFVCILKNYFFNIYLVIK